MGHESITSKPLTVSYSRFSRQNYDQQNQYTLTNEYTVNLHKTIDLSRVINITESEPL